MLNIQIDQALIDKMVEKALAECADLNFAGDTHRLRQAITQGHCEYCQQLNGCLARRVGEYLGRVDRTVKAIYLYEPVDASEEGGFQLSLPAPPEGKFVGVNLIVWVERKSAALSALLETLEAALSASHLITHCADATPSCYALDVKLVSDLEVQESRGLGLLVKHHYLRSYAIWSQPTPPESTGAEPEPTQHEESILLPDLFDPEFIPEGRLLEHAQSIENIPPNERGALEHHLTELKVILIRRLISDQLAYINIAKRWFSIADLKRIHRRKIGLGKIGGKAAGMLLAANILSELGDDELRSHLQVPESFFIGSDVMYIYLAMNGLMYWNDQKYKPENQIRDEYPLIKQQFQAGRFPPEVLVELQGLLERVGNKPIIVRSSSQLEDNLGTSFAGKYNSYFCPNQASPQENLAALTQAIARTYASTLKPDALLYRRSKGLQDYDERMAILIQIVQGEQFGRYYLPHAAGVAFSRNLYRWSPDIRKEDGFARLVWGLGTRAVERVGDDYPRLIALSHPTLQPDDSTEAIRRYSQRYVDVIDLQENTFVTLPVAEVLTPYYPPVRLLTQLEKDGFFSTLRMRVSEADIPRLAFTFDELLRRTNFAQSLSRILHLLEENYHAAVDMEFTLQIPDPRAPNPSVIISLLQCRPQSHLKGAEVVHLPEDIPGEDIVFCTHFMVPQGYLADIRYVLYVPAEAYFALPSLKDRQGISKIISTLNARLGEKSFICVGPGRWGSINPDLGVFVSYADINNAGALVELSGKGVGPAPEPSLGTHFFQDLMEAQIYPLAIPLDEKNIIFNREFFYSTANSLADFVTVDDASAQTVRLIDVAKARPGYHLELIMDDEKGQAVAYLVADK
jgi:hypothetical protein